MTKQTKQDEQIKTESTAIDENAKFCLFRAYYNLVDTQKLLKLGNTEEIKEHITSSKGYVKNALKFLGITEEEIKANKPKKYRKTTPEEYMIKKLQNSKEISNR